MNKAEEKAIRHCCTNCTNNKLNCGMKLISHGRNCIACSNYIKGYEQAEKDLELTIEDIKTIDKLLNQCVDCSNPYQEVLKRFKDLKKY